MYLESHMCSVHETFIAINLPSLASYQKVLIFISYNMYTDSYILYIVLIRTTCTYINYTSMRYSVGL
jgi:hypothetical protein